MRFDIVIHQIEIIRVKIELDDIAVEVIYSQIIPTKIL